MSLANRGLLVCCLVKVDVSRSVTLGLKCFVLHTMLKNATLILRGTYKNLTHSSGEQVVFFQLTKMDSSHVPNAMR